MRVAPAKYKGGRSMVSMEKNGKAPANGLAPEKLALQKTLEKKKI
jgi:hypothetical protein